MRLIFALILFLNLQAKAQYASGSIKIEGGQLKYWSSGQWVVLPLNGSCNAATLEEQNGSFYLSRGNHTGTQLKSTISDFPTTTAGFANSTDKNFVTDAKLTVVNNTSGTNTGDNAVNSNYSGLAASKADVASPTLTGTPLAPTAAFNTNTTQIATAAFVRAQTPTYARVTGSNFTTTGQTLVDITGLSVALTTNAVYEIEAVLSVSTTAVTTGTQYGIQYSVAAGAIEAQVTGPLTSTASKTERISALNTATTAFLTTSAQTGGVTIKGIVTTGANAGNLTVRTLKVTSGTSTVFINSYLKVTRIN